MNLDYYDDYATDGDLAGNGNAGAGKTNSN